MEEKEFTWDISDAVIDTLEKDVGLSVVEEAIPKAWRPPRQRRWFDALEFIEELSDDEFQDLQLIRAGSPSIEPPKVLIDPPLIEEPVKAVPDQTPTVVAESFTLPISTEEHGSVISESPFQPKRKRWWDGLTLSEGSRAIGFDIGSRSIKFVEINRSPSGLSLRNYGYYPLPLVEDEDQREEAAEQILREIFGSVKAKSARLVTAVTGLEVIFRSIRVPRMSKKELKEAITWACRKELPFPVEAAYLDFAPAGEAVEGGTTRNEVMVLAAPRKLVEGQLSLLKQVGVTPAKISAVPSAIWNLVARCPQLKSQKSLMVIDIGAATSNISFIKDGSLQFVREVTTAGDDFTEALTGTLFFEGEKVTLTQNQATAFKEKYGIPDENSEEKSMAGVPLKEVAVALRPVVERLVNEIQRSMDYFKEKFRVEKIEKTYITGGGALLKNLTENLARELTIPVEVLNPVTLLFNGQKKLWEDERLARIAPALAVPIGLALDKKKELNLLPPHLRTRSELQLGKKLLRYGALLVVLLLVAFTGQTSLQSEQFRNDFKRLQVEYQKLEPKRKLYVALKGQSQELTARKQIYDQQIRTSTVVADYLKALSQLVPENVALTGLSIRSDAPTVPAQNTKKDAKKAPEPMKPAVHLQGFVFKNNPMEGVSLADFLLRLQNCGYFSQVRLESQAPDGSGDEGLNFQIICDF